jgi:hypothetical protein
MRQELECERGVAPYRLRVEVDESTLVDRLVAAAGARADRPLYVFEQLPMPPGTHHVEIAFIREGDAEDEMEDESEEDDARRTAPARLTLDTVVVLAAGRAALITYHEDTRRLRLVTRH